MSGFFKRITSSKPYVYGAIYLALIPLYAVIFWLIPDANLDLKEHEAGVVSSLYFSVITITTLGYGDITPIGAASQILTASESILGITLIGLFLNALSHQHGLEVQGIEKKKQFKREKNQAKGRFISFDQLVGLNIGFYERYTFSVTTPIINRDAGAGVVNEKFVFSDMQDLFKPTLRMTDNHFTPAIDYYFRSLKELVSSLEDLVKHGYAQHWPELENLCLSFISTSKTLDCSEYILNQPKVKLGEQLGSDFDAELIKKHEGEVKFLPSNTINGYVALYTQIHAGFEFIKEYRRIASEIKNS